MTDAPNTNDEPAVTGVPPETPDSVRPSATGVVVGPLDGPTDVEVAEIHVDDDGEHSLGDDPTPPA